MLCVRVLAFPECLCCAACSVSLNPFVFHGSRPELLATAVKFFFLLASFGLWCHICYFVGCFQKFGWQLLVFDSLHCQRIFTMVCGSGLCSTSFPGGHQVDGLPPASSDNFPCMMDFLEMGV